MNSPPFPRLGLWPSLPLTGLSAVLLGFGTGLTPSWWCAWIAALPVLVVAARSRARIGLAAGTVAWLGGQTPMWGYYAGVLELPPALVAALIVGTSVLFGLAVAAFAAIAGRGRPVLATLAFCSAWVAVEFAVSLTMPHGAWWSMAYSQADALPVLQIVSLTGPWGVTFLLLGVQAAVAVLPSARRRAPLAAGVAAVLALVLGYGLVRLAGPSGVPAGGPVTRVALLDTDRPDDTIPVATPEGGKLLARYLAELGKLEADVVVLPENTFAADRDTLPLLAGPLSALAAERNTTVLVGLTLVDGAQRRNSALAFAPGAARPVRYDKRHLIPGVETDYSPGRPEAVAFVPGSDGRWAIVICKDLDFPELVRDYRRRGASAVFAPAWDFPGDEWIHSRMALVRGVESGMTVVRAPRAGILLASDAYGRVLAQARTGPGFVSAVFTLPEPVRATPYSVLGDWLGWAGLLILPAALIAGLRGSRGGGRGADGSGRAVGSFSGRRASRRLAHGRAPRP
ncbi:nitrilase-related carbon-nitrogen hydrolase [Nonomuraea sp. NPDC049152]|uniref:nitrilase-related carbon-nitrogen hydrolase n=1 Tax=Nonomuraea sp. NPDC049152 TaxID=3154350 RepID=UPI0033D04F38